MGDSRVGGVDGTRGQTVGSKGNNCGSEGSNTFAESVSSPIPHVTPQPDDARQGLRERVAKIRNRAPYSTMAVFVPDDWEFGQRVRVTPLPPAVSTTRETDK